MTEAKREGPEYERAELPVGGDGDPDCCLGISFGAPFSGLGDLRGSGALVDRAGSGESFQGLGAWGGLWQCWGSVRMVLLLLTEHLNMNTQTFEI